jgi:hypothetical protein
LTCGGGAVPVRKPARAVNVVAPCAPPGGRLRFLALVVAAVAAGACQRQAPVLPRDRPAVRPDLLAGCYAMEYGGPTYRSADWPEDWRSRFIAPQRFAVAPLLPRSGSHTSRVLVIPLSWDGPTRPRVIAHLTSDADSLLIGSGVHGDGVAFRLALQGDTLPGVAALSGGREALEPAHNIRRVMAVRVDCRTGQPVSLLRRGTRR